MAESRKQPRVNPILKELTDRGKGDVLTQLKGFVGEGPNGFIRIYPSFEMSSYVDVDSDDVVHFIDSDEDDKPTELFVRASARVRLTQVRSSTAEAQNLDASDKHDCGCGGGGQTIAELRALPGIIASGTIGAIAPDTENECFRNCAFSFRRCLRAGLGYAYCSAEDDLCAARCEAIFPRGGPILV